MSKLTETLKKPTPALWRALIICNIIAVVICGAAAIFAGPSWNGMLDAMIAGFNVAAAFYNYLQMRSCESNNRLIEICTEQQAMLRAFMEDAVKVHFMGMVEEETPPTAPRLH